MSLAEVIHGNYVYDRRTHRLSEHLAQIIPQNFSVLDVGCGDGLLAQLIAESRPDISLTGIDVLARDCTYIPVRRFDGSRIPYHDKSFDAVMFVDVLHHTSDATILLRDAVRVARTAVIVKDHTLTGWYADLILRLMDFVGNARHGIALPYNYWPKQRWLETFDSLGLRIGAWMSNLAIYPWPASLIFDRSLHFAARLEIIKS